MHSRSVPNDRRLNETWLRSATVNYVNHIEGESIRALARSQGCNASTVSRQVRRVKELRNNPDVAKMITEIKARHSSQKGPVATGAHNEKEAQIVSALQDTDCVLVHSENMPKAVVAREAFMSSPETILVVDAELALALAVRGVLVVKFRGRVTKYELAKEYRSDAVKRLENPQEEGIYKARNETPLEMLSRRIDKSGKPFLSKGLQKAGARLKEDFEISNFGTLPISDIDVIVSGKCDLGNLDDLQSLACENVKSAIKTLGPGLSEIALRCCCFQQGLETAEKEIGWSARSGKIVLRIALQRLRLHYEDVDKIGGGLIG